MYFLFFALSLQNSNSNRRGGDGPGPSTSSGLPFPIGGRSGQSETTHIGLAALQQKALKQQEQLEKTSLGFRFPLQMSPLLSRTDFRKLRQVSIPIEYLFIGFSWILESPMLNMHYSLINIS